MHKGGSGFPGKQKAALRSQGNAEFSFLFAYSGAIDSGTAMLRAYFGSNNYEIRSFALMVFVLWRITGSASRQLRHPSVSSRSPGPVCLKLRMTL